MPAADRHGNHLKPALLVGTITVSELSQTTKIMNQEQQAIETRVAP